jgi:hypothetical protein
MRFDSSGAVSAEIRELDVPLKFSSGEHEGPEMVVPVQDEGSKNQ